MPTTTYIPHPLTAWQFYRDSVYEKTLIPPQEAECSRAFFAGMMASLLFVGQLPDDIDPNIILTYIKLINTCATNPNPWLH